MAWWEPDLFSGIMKGLVCNPFVLLTLVQPTTKQPSADVGTMPPDMHTMAGAMRTTLELTASECNEADGGCARYLSSLASWSARLSRRAAEGGRKGAGRELF